MVIQMKPLTTNMTNFLCKLHEASDGVINEYYPIKAHWKVIEELYNRNLIMRDAQIESGKVIRYSALTELGQQYSCEYMGLVINNGVLTTERPQKCVSLFFEYDEIKYPHHVTAYKHVGKLKAERNFRPTMIDLLNIDEQLESGKTGLLEEMYPEAIDALKEKIRKEIEMAYYEKIMSRLDKIETTPQSRPMPEITQSVGIKGLGGGVGLKGAGIKGLGNVGTLPPPEFDDDDMPALTITKSKDAGNQANRNLINAMKALQES